MYCDIPDFGRCCFCLPLRRGVLIFGYLNVLFAAFMVGVYSFFMHVFEESENSEENDGNLVLIYRGVRADCLSEICIAIYCLDIIVNCVLVYGAHKSVIRCLRIYYYYAITTTLTALLLEVLEFTKVHYLGSIFEILILSFVGFCIQLYLIILVRSLLRKLEISTGHCYDNQLNMVVTGQQKIENEVYNNSTVVPNN